MAHDGESDEDPPWWSDASRRERQVQENHDARLEETAQREAAFLADRKERLQEAIEDMRTAAERRRKELAEADTRVKLMSDELLAEKEQINEMSAKLRLQRTQMNENMFKREAETKKRIDECGAEIETKLEQKFAY
jgi:hypothetical protein